MPFKYFPNLTYLQKLVIRLFSTYTKAESFYTAFGKFNEMFELPIIGTIDMVSENLYSDLENGISVFDPIPELFMCIFFELQLKRDPISQKIIYNQTIVTNIPPIAYSGEIAQRFRSMHIVERTFGCQISASQVSRATVELGEKLQE